MFLSFRQEIVSTRDLPPLLGYPIRPPAHVSRFADNPARLYARGLWFRRIRPIQRLKVKKRMGIPGRFKVTQGKDFRDRSSDSRAGPR